jgi:hypothetical protein
MGGFTLSLVYSLFTLSACWPTPIHVKAAPYNHFDILSDNHILPSHVRRNIFGPIATDKPEPAGGTVANTAPPLASFFVDMNPPVSRTSSFRMCKKKINLACLVSHEYVVERICCNSGNCVSDTSVITFSIMYFCIV